MRAFRFGLLESYIWRQAVTGFALTLIVLTALIWITQALRELDLLTAKGQTILVFFTMTSLSIPALVTVIAPVALFIAVLFTLNKLNSDSELIVMSAAGTAPGRILKPFLALALLVSLLVGTMTLYAMPASFREIRDLITKIRADFVANIVREGEFTTLEAGVTFHFRERAGDTLLGVFMQDRRDKERTSVYIAERGRSVEQDGASYLILEKGSVQRQQPGERDTGIIVFERYAVDLEQLGAGNDSIVYKPRERSTTELMFPDVDEGYYKLQSGRFRAELHDRLSAPLYPLAMMLAAFAALGSAQTTRQGRGLAMAGAVAAVVGLRIAGFVISSTIVRAPWAVPLAYAAPLVVCLVALLQIARPQSSMPGRALLERLIARGAALRPAAAQA